MQAHSRFGVAPIKAPNQKCDSGLSSGRVPIFVPRKPTVERRLAGSLKDPHELIELMGEFDSFE